MFSSRSQSAFSLVELSIVLVILGLLTGGILSGQSLIRAAEIRTVARDFSTYMAATHTFRDKYFAIPGDMPNATQFWGRQYATNCAANSGAGVATPGACDGNGDGMVLLSNWNGTSYRATESFQYFRQLALAGLISGDYPGTWLTSGSVVGIYPRSPLSPNSAYTINFSNMTTFAPFYTLNYGNFIQISGIGANLLSPEEAWNIDTKIDDGRPAYGRIIAVNIVDQCASARSGASTQTNYDADYRLADPSRQCSLILRNL